MSGRENVVPISSPGGAGSGGSDDIGQRLARIEATIEHMATREDVADVKTLIERNNATMTRWLVGILLTALGIVASCVVAIIIALVKGFSGSGF